MTDEQIEKAVQFCSLQKGCRKECPCFLPENTHCDEIDYIMRLKSAKQLAEANLKKLLSTLYRQTSERGRGDFVEHKGITLYLNDIVELAKDCGIKEEELK